MSRFQSFTDTNRVATIYSLEELLNSKDIEIGMPNDTFKLCINYDAMCNIIYDENNSAIQISICYRGQSPDEIEIETISVDEFVARVFNRDDLPKYENRKLVEEPAVSVEE